MRGAPASPLLLLLAWRGPSACSRTSAARAWTQGARARTSLAHEWTLVARVPGPLPARPGLPGGAGLARALGRWAGSSGALRGAVLAGPLAPRPPRTRLQGGSAAAARAGDPGDNSRRRLAAAGRPEAWKLLGLVRPERGRLAGRKEPAGGRREGGTCRGPVPLLS